MKPILDLIVALRFSRSHMQALLLLVACLVPACMSAQTGNYLTTEKELSSSVVKQIYQDHYGIIWIATNSGVNVYNGYQMRTYQRNVEQSNSLASNLVNGFCEDRDGKLYFQADSDAIIVKGLISLLIRVFSGRTPQEILDADLYFIDKIGFKDNLSPTRSNGLLSMVKKIRAYALAFKIKEAQ